MVKSSARTADDIGGGAAHGARHVAIIMDGNGRWAKRRHLPRAMGHQRGVEAVRKLVRGLGPMGLECLTLYAFSSENWKRPEDEISDLMGLMRKFIKSDLPDFIANDVRLKILGDYSAMPGDIVDQLEDALARTAGAAGPWRWRSTTARSRRSRGPRRKPLRRGRSRSRRSPPISIPPICRRS